MRPGQKYTSRQHTECLVNTDAGGVAASVLHGNYEQANGANGQAYAIPESFMESQREDENVDCDSGKSDKKAQIKNVALIRYSQHVAGKAGGPHDIDNRDKHWQ